MPKYFVRFELKARFRLTTYQGLQEAGAVRNAEILTGRFAGITVSADVDEQNVI